MEFFFSIFFQTSNGVFTVSRELSREEILIHRDRF